MSQQLETDNDLPLHSLQLNSNNLANANGNGNSTSNRLPLRKRMAPALKWQPVETPEEHHKSNSTYPQQYPTNFSSEEPASDGGGDTTETDEEKSQEDKAKPLKKHWILKQDDRESEDEIMNTRPVKKVKRGRPPSQKHNIMESKPFLSEPPAMPSTPSTPTPPINTATRPPPDVSIDKDTLYCICKRPYDVPRFMIACDKCDQWFHGECIQISEKQGEFIDLYFCENCSQITGKKTSWKPKCANPACQKAARIGTHQGHLSKYCTDNCGMQVARARIELAEMKKRNSTLDPTAAFNPLTRDKLLSFADQDDRYRLARLKDERSRAKYTIEIDKHKSHLLQLLTESSLEDTCGFDSRLSWPDSVWENVESIEPSLGDNTHALKDKDGLIVTAGKQHIVCQARAKCMKHQNWQKLKTVELEQERAEQFVILTMLERERQQIRARMKKRREEADLVDLLENGTINHFK